MVFTKEAIFHHPNQNIHWKCLMRLSLLKSNYIFELINNILQCTILYSDFFLPFFLFVCSFCTTQELYYVEIVSQEKLETANVSDILKTKWRFCFLFHHPASDCNVIQR